MSWISIWAIWFSLDDDESFWVLALYGLFLLFEIFISYTSSLWGFKSYGFQFVDCCSLLFWILSLLPAPPSDVDFFRIEISWFSPFWVLTLLMFRFFSIWDVSWSCTWLVQDCSSLWPGLLEVYCVTIHSSVLLYFNCIFCFCIDVGHAAHTYCKVLCFVFFKIIQRIV